MAETTQKETKSTPKETTQKETKSTPKETTQKETKSTPKETTQKETRGKGVFYWVKVRSYVHDAVLDRKEGERLSKVVGKADVWEPGLYQVSENITRFDNSPKRYVERFDGDIPEVKVYEIAKTYKVSTEDGKGNLRKPADILAEVVKEREVEKQN